MPLNPLSWLLHAYVALRIGLDLPPVPGLLFGALMLASALLLPFGLRPAAARGSGPRRGADLGRARPDGPVLVAVRADAVARCAAARRRWRSAQASCRCLAMRADVVRDSARPRSPLLGALASAVGLLQCAAHRRVVRVDVPIAGLPAALARLHHRADQRHPRRADDQGATIVQAIVDAVNRDRRRHGRGHRRPGRRQRARTRPRTSRRWPICASRHGTFFVTGNHEYYSGAARVGPRAAPPRRRTC